MWHRLVNASHSPMFDDNIYIEKIQPEATKNNAPFPIKY